MSGFEITIVVTLCQTQSVQSVTPLCTTHLNRFCTECCLEVTVIVWLSNVTWAANLAGWGLYLSCRYHCHYHCRCRARNQLQLVVTPPRNQLHQDATGCNNDPVVGGCKGGQEVWSIRHVSQIILFSTDSGSVLLSFLTPPLSLRGLRTFCEGRSGSRNIHRQAGTPDILP